jgi:hypothetical protein
VKEGVTKRKSEITEGDEDEGRVNKIVARPMYVLYLP